MKSKLIFAFGFLLLAAFGWRFVLESRKVLSFPPSAWTEGHRADCAVVLTGGPGRVREGFDLLVQGRIKKLIISGVYQHSDMREIFPQLPYYSSIDTADVILEKRSQTTFGNAQQSLPLVEALRCRDLILVTSDLHMYRSMRIFHKVFPIDFAIYPRAVIAYRYRPHWSDVAQESMKTIFYSTWAY